MTHTMTNTMVGLMMGDLSERTKVTLQASAAIGVLAAAVTAGSYWGSWRSERVTTEKTLINHEQRMDRLEERLVNQDKLLIEINAGMKAQSEGTNTAARNSTAALWAIQDLQLSLAEQGIKIKTANRDNHP